MYSDLQTISPEQYMKQITKRLTELHAVSVSLCIHLMSKDQTLQNIILHLKSIYFSDLDF